MNYLPDAAQMLAALSFVLWGSVIANFLQFTYGLWSASNIDPRKIVAWPLALLLSVITLKVMGF